MLEDRNTRYSFRKRLVSSVLSTRGGGTIPPNGPSEANHDSDCTRNERPRQYDRRWEYRGRVRGHCCDSPSDRGGNPQSGRRRDRMHWKRRSKRSLTPTFIIVVRPAIWKVRMCLRLSISLAWPEIADTACHFTRDDRQIPGCRCNGPWA
jgi:hypothetical protein